MARDRDYPKLLNDVHGKKVAIWTCNTCARLCRGIGGTRSAERLADAFRNDGIDVTDVAATSAGCMMSKIKDKEFGKDADVIVSLMCDIGSECATSVFGKYVLNPIVTFGPGYLDGNDEPFAIIDGKPVSLKEKTGFKNDTEFPFM